MGKALFALLNVSAVLLFAHAFTPPASLFRGPLSRIVTRGTCAKFRMTAGADTALHRQRRGFIAAALTLTLLPKEAISDGADEVVVNGEMRLEVGSDKKLAAVGGKAVAKVALRCVGKGIISQTDVEINLPDFPPPGQPKAGESGGVPFVVKASDLVAKTEKGYTVTRDLWADDDIFVAVDVSSPAGKRILRGIGKAKMKPVNGVNAHQKPLILLE